MGYISNNKYRFIILNGTLSTDLLTELVVCTSFTPGRGDADPSFIILTSVPDNDTVLEVELTVAGLVEIIVEAVVGLTGVLAAEVYGAGDPTVVVAAVVLRGMPPGIWGACVGCDSCMWPKTMPWRPPGRLF